MNNGGFYYGTFFVAFGEQRDIDSEWNNVVWDRNHRQIQYHRLYYVTSGSGKIKLFGRDLELRAGNVYFLPAFSIVGSSVEDKMNKYYLHFQVESHFFDMYRYVSDKFSVPAKEETEGLFKTVISNFADNSWAGKMRVQGAMNMLMADFVGDVSLDNKALAKFMPVLSYIDEHYKTNINLSHLASIMNVSTMYFSNLFKSTFNVSPKQYILNKRLTESQRLLLETDLSIREIASLVGFDNENYFSEFFTNKVGISALRFRNRQLPTGVDSIL